MCRGWAGCESAKGSEDLPERGGWDGSRDHRVVVPQVWTPDQEHHHHLGDVLEMEDKSPSQTYSIRNSGAVTQ